MNVEFYTQWHLNTALASLDAKFDSMYAPTGRDSIAPEKLLRALVLQAVYQFVEVRAKFNKLLRSSRLFRITYFHGVTGGIAHGPGSSTVLKLAGPAISRYSMSSE